MPSDSEFEPRSPRYGPFLVSGCWCTLCSLWGFLAPFWAVSRTYRGVRGHQRSLGHEKVKPHSESPNKTPRPPYQWSLGGAGGQPGPRTAGANGGSTRVPGAKKIIFSKVVPRPLGMLKQVFLARFEPVVTRFGPWKFPKCLENGPFQDRKYRSKTCFSKSDPRPLEMLGQVSLAHFEPIWTGFGPWKSQYSWKRGHFGIKNGWVTLVKNVFFQK